MEFHGISIVLYRKPHPRLVPSLHVGEHASRIDFWRDLPRSDLSISGPAAVAVASVARPEDVFRVAEEHDELGVFRQFLVPVLKDGRYIAVTFCVIVVP